MHVFRMSRSRCLMPKFCRNLKCKFLTGRGKFSDTMRLVHINIDASLDHHLLDPASYCVSAGFLMWFLMSNKQPGFATT